MRKIHITTLGCSKNTVDSEWLTGYLETNQFEVIDNPKEAEVLILNTCGFIFKIFQVFRFGIQRLMN